MTKQGQQKPSQALATQGTNAIADYGEWTPEQADKEDKEMATGGDWWTPAVGKTTVRFLPPKKDWPSPFVITHQHFIKLPGVEHNIIFSCPREHTSGKCIACELADKYETSGSKRDFDAARNMRPSRRVFANVVVNPKDPQAEVSRWGFGSRIWRDLKAIRDDEENGGNFTDPANGFNIVVDRVGTGKMDTKYSLLAGRNRGPLANFEWINQQYDLRRMVRIPSEEQQRRLLDGDDPRDVFNDDEGKSDRRSSPAGKVIDVDAKTRTAGDDVFDDEVDVD